LNKSVRAAVFVNSFYFKNLK